ncbi:MAG: hypothetical protein WDM77_02320 [Steroidobacteraceae bacterium]
MFTQREGDVLEHIDVSEQRAVLKQHAEAPAQRKQPAAVQTGQIFTEQLHLAALRIDLRGDQSQQGGLAGAAGTHHRRDLPLQRLE